MDETSDLVTHYMALGAERRLGDYLSLRNIYGKIADQEFQFDRLQGMFDDFDDYVRWRAAVTPSISYTRPRISPYVWPGSIAYLRFREREKEELSKPRSTIYTSRHYRTVRSTHD